MLNRNLVFILLFSDFILSLLISSSKISIELYTKKDTYHTAILSYCTSGFYVYIYKVLPSVLHDTSESSEFYNQKNKCRNCHSGAFYKTLILSGRYLLVQSPEQLTRSVKSW